MEVVDLSKDKQLEALLKEELPAFQSDVDLMTAAINHLDFLKSVDQGREAYYFDEAFVSRALYRYEALWMPFLAAVSNEGETDLEFAPPPDVHWVWHVHMLAPVVYAFECRQVVGRVLGHRPVTQAKLVDLRSKTEKVWQVHFQGMEPFDIGTKVTQEEEAAMTAFASKIKYDIADAAKRQAVFYYQVSLDHFRDPLFLADGLRRYKMYLLLKRRNPDRFLVPCYDMDLIWHTHQVHSVEYQRDTTAILGFVLKHDDSVNDRSEGSKLNVSDDLTRRLWMETFGVPFPRPGSMFRGNPPYGKLMLLTEKYQRGLLAPKEIDVELNSVRMPSLPSVVQADKAILTVQLETGSNGLLKKKYVDLYSSECNLSDDLSLESPDGGLVNFSVSRSNCPKLNLKLASKSGKKKKWFGNGRRASIALSETPIDLFALSSFAGAGASGEATKTAKAAAKVAAAAATRASSDDALSISHRLTVNSKEACQDVIWSELRLNVTNERLGTPTESKFHIAPGSFYDCIIPEDIESLWGPIPLLRLPQGVSNKCRAVTHG